MNNINTIEQKSFHEEVISLSKQNKDSKFKNLIKIDTGVLGDKYWYIGMVFNVCICYHN